MATSEGGDRSAGNRYRLHQSLDDTFRYIAMTPVHVPARYHAMGKHRDGQPFDVIRHDIIAILDQCQGLAGTIETKRAARAGTDMQFFAVASRFDDIQKVTADRPSAQSGHSR